MDYRQERLNGANHIADYSTDKSIRRGPLDIPFLLLVLILLTIGVVMLLSASYARAYYAGKAPTYYFVRQLAFAVLGVAAMFFMLAACAAEGETVIDGAAREPEIEDLQEYLRRLGAYIEGAGTDRITISGFSPEPRAGHRVMQDEIRVTVIATGFDDSPVHPSEDSETKKFAPAPKAAEKPQGLFTAASEKKAAEPQPAPAPATSDAEEDPFDSIFKIFNSK